MIILLLLVAHWCVHSPSAHVQYKCFCIIRFHSSLIQYEIMPCTPKISSIFWLCSPRLELSWCMREPDGGQRARDTLFSRASEPRLARYISHTRLLVYVVPLNSLHNGRYSGKDPCNTSSTKKKRGTNCEKSWSSMQSPETPSTRKLFCRGHQQSSRYEIRCVFLITFFERNYFSYTSAVSCSHIRGHSVTCHGPKMPANISHIFDHVWWDNRYQQKPNNR